MEESKSHGFTLAQLEKFAETVARTGSTSAHVLGDDGAWVEEQAPPPGVVVARLIAGFFSWAHIEPCGSLIGCGCGRPGAWAHIEPCGSLWNDFQGQEFVAMCAAWDRARAQAAAEAMAPNAHGFTLVQLEAVVAREARTRSGQPYVLGADGAWVVTPEPPVGEIVVRRFVVQDGSARFFWGRVTDVGVFVWNDFSSEEATIMNACWCRVLERERTFTLTAPATNRAPVAESGPLTIRGRHGPADDELVAKLAEAEFLRRELATPPKGLTLEQWHAFVAWSTEESDGGHRHGVGPETMTAAAVSALRSDVESGTTLVPKRILGHDTQLRHRELSTKPKREWWK